MNEDELYLKWRKQALQGHCTRDARSK